MILKILKLIQPCWKRFCIQVNAVLISFEKGLRVGRTWKESMKTGGRNHLKTTSAGVVCSKCVPTSCKIIWTCRLWDWPRMIRWKLKFWPISRMSRPEKKQNQEPFPWMWIPLLRVREKENMTKGKAKVSPKVRTKERVSLRLGQTIHTTRVLGTVSLGISSLGINKTPMTPRAKGKARKVKTKVKVKVIKVKVAKLPMLSLILGLKSNLQQLPLVINLNLNSQRCLPWKTLCRLSLKLKRNHLVVVEVQGELHSKHLQGALWPGALWWWLRVLWHQLLGPTRSFSVRWSLRLRALSKMLRTKGSKQIRPLRNAKKPWTSWRKRQSSIRKRPKRQWPKWGQKAVLLQHRLHPLVGCKPT